MNNVKITKPKPRPVDRVTQLRLELLRQLAEAGPERFDLGSVISTTDDDYDVDREAGERPWFDVVDTSLTLDDRTTSQPEVLNVLDAVTNAVTYGGCGRTACVAGHLQAILWRTEKRWLSYSHVIHEAELPLIICEGGVDVGHPYEELYDTLRNKLNDSFSEYSQARRHAEWMVSMLALNDLVDGRHRSTNYCGTWRYVMEEDGETIKVFDPRDELVVS